jgi:lipoprotein-anchoring transpeptidase ErfK/SrfK
VLRPLIALVTAAVIAVVALFAAGVIGGGDDAGDVAGSGTTTHAVDTTASTPPAKRDTRPRSAIVRRATILRDRPKGKALTKIGTKTTWKADSWRNPRVLPVTAVKGAWVRVIATELPNGRQGWIEAKDTQLVVNDWSVAVDLGARTIAVTDKGKVVRRFKAAVGEQGTATPTGEFAITDRLSFGDAGSAYGCCALALSAHQHDFATDWKGGDRVAIHATPTKSSIGRAATHGCMRVADADARWLITHVPLGTVVKISS